MLIHEIWCLALTKYLQIRTLQVSTIRLLTIRVGPKDALYKRAKAKEAMTEPVALYRYTSPRISDFTGAGLERQ